MGPGSLQRPGSQRGSQCAPIRGALETQGLPFSQGSHCLPFYLKFNLSQLYQEGWKTDWALLFTLLG